MSYNLFIMNVGRSSENHTHAEASVLVDLDDEDNEIEVLYFSYFLYALCKKISL